MIASLHPDAARVLVGRGLLATNRAMERNIGRHVRFIVTKENKRQLGTDACTKLYKIIGVQKDHEGSLCYRVVCVEYNDTFGRPAAPDEIRLV
jgi:hypothetical protein